MPVIVYEGTRMDKEKRKELIERLTDTAAQVTGINREAFLVYIHENRHGSIGVGGRPLDEMLGVDAGDEG